MFSLPEGFPANCFTNVVLPVCLAPRKKTTGVSERASVNQVYIVRLFMV
jgi:hypothetical protein